MGEGPKDLRDDAGRFDAPRNDYMVGRGDPAVSEALCSRLELALCKALPSTPRTEVSRLG